HGKQGNRLRALVRKVDPGVEPTLTVLALLRVLRVVGDGRAAESLLRSALVSRPGEAVLLTALGSLLMEQRPPRFAEAVEYLRAARALRPELGIRLSYALVGTQRAGEAEAVLRDLVRLRPDNPELHLHLSALQLKQDKFGKAE